MMSIGHLALEHPLKKYPKKYQVRLNKHLVGHVLDTMHRYDSQRGVVTCGITSANAAIKRATWRPERHCQTIRRLTENRSQGDITLAELMTILDDSEAASEVQNSLLAPYMPARFAAKTQQRLREFCEAACAEVDRGLFRT